MKLQAVPEIEIVEEQEEETELGGRERLAGVALAVVGALGPAVHHRAVSAIRGHRDVRGPERLE